MMETSQQWRWRRRTLLWTPCIKPRITWYSPARRSANVKARSAERGSWVESHLSGFSMLSMENDEVLRSDSISVVGYKFLLLCCWHRIFLIVQTVTGGANESCPGFLFLLSVVDKNVDDKLIFNSSNTHEHYVKIKGYVQPRCFT